MSENCRSAPFNRWSCCRFNANNAWNYNNIGVANNNNFYNRLGVSAVSAFIKICDMIELSDLYKVYYMARANKRRSHDAVAFEVRLESNLSSLCRHINECTYRAHDNYTFISLHPQPREIFGCEMSVRIIQWYVLWRLTPILEDTLIDGLYSNRKGKGVDAAVSKVYGDIMEVSRHYTRDAYIIQWDLQGYYPNADCSVACRKLQRLVADRYDGNDKDSLLWMIMITVHANPQRHCYRKSGIEAWSAIPYAKSILNKPDGTGGVIGFLVWQTAMNLYLDDIDHWLTDEMGLHYTRYADDSALVVQNKEAALALFPLLRERYAEVGCTMHPGKFYCQHVSKGMRFLGAHIKFERIYVNNRVVRNARERIRLFNRCRNKFRSLYGFLATVNSYFGRMKNRNEFNSIKSLWESVDKGWHRYARMDWDRLCVVPDEGCTHHLYFYKRFKNITSHERKRRNGDDARTRARSRSGK